MSNWKLLIPQDRTVRPGMKLLQSEKQESRVNYLQDVVYAERDGQPLHLQMLIPGLYSKEFGMIGNWPLVVFIQGSGWGKQNCYFSLPNLYPLAKAGYIVASVEHRSSEVAKFPAFLQDVKTAIRYLRAHAGEYGIDKNRIGVWGDSSGGNAALLTGFTAGMPEFATEDYPEESDAVRAVVDFYGPTDVSRIQDVPRDPSFDYEKPQPEDVLFGGRVADHPEIAAPGNPLNYISEEKEIPPVMIAHGDADAVVPFNQSVLLYDKLVECNKVVEFYKSLAADHGFFMWTDELIRNVIGFFDMYLREEE